MFKYFARIILSVATFFVFWLIIKNSCELIVRLNVQKNGKEVISIVIGKYKKKAHWLVLEFKTSQNVTAKASAPVSTDLWNNLDIGHRIKIKYSEEYPTIVIVSNGDISIRRIVFGLILSGILGVILFLSLIFSLQKEYAYGKKKDFWECIEMLKQEGIEVPIERLEAHYLAKGNIESLVKILIEMKYQSKKIDVEKACALDFLEDQK
ncbi:MAG: hypothetical protein D6732_13580 [Methanobacteriota archaeon]|nr:MAG: hypothetical protein D6732_13580 [Euryarchaeota archaeon]